MAKESAEFRLFSQHFDPEISKEIRDYATNVVLIDSRYLFINPKVKGIQFAHCTHCKSNHMTDGALKHGMIAKCVQCRSECHVRATGVSRSKLKNNGYLVYYEKSAIDPQAIVARGIYVCRDYTGDFRTVETRCETTAMFLFRMNGSIMYEKHWASWYKREGEDIRSEFPQYASWAIRECSKESIEKAVKGTPFQYSEWKAYDEYDWTKYFALYSKHPCIELLTKMKMKYFVSAKLYGGLTFGAIDWKATNIRDVLKLDGQQFRELTSIKDRSGISALTIRLMQISKKDNSKLSLDELNEIAKRFEHRFSDLKKALKYTNIRRANAYLLRQFTKQPRKEHFHRLEEVLIHWKDYIADCENLGMDLSDERILFPGYLHAAHQNTIGLVKAKASELLNQKIADRKQRLERYAFELGPLTIRAAASSDELVEEGKKLQHCVGNYIDRYANGKTDILVIRRKLEPDKPFFTMEIQKGEIIQTRGFRNCATTDEVKLFVAAFENARLNKQTRITVKAQQGIAI
ncbi:PcfJ-like protein [Cohnella sp. OV330]|uniref:PcfJ domain-containing protein n=1 Tax=Cohnella sp. OV330 TaxID=1855288 RepID=UPI0008E58105|nr:PcfJ domain-containing protein [Cohnella sp. OV330]SFB62695.1 PcfJ-like protein [Cohnella sp. OV330]